MTQQNTTKHYEPAIISNPAMFTRDGAAGAELFGAAGEGSDWRRSSFVRSVGASTGVEFIEDDITFLTSINKGIYLA